MVRSLVIAAAMSLVSGAAAGATFGVNSALDAVDAAPGDGMCATSGAVCTLRAAIQEANAVPGPDVITLPAGTYILTIPGRGEMNAATGDLNIRNGTDLTIDGAGAAATIIDANGLDRVFTVFMAVLTLNDVTIQNGNSDNSPGGCVLTQAAFHTTTHLTLVRAVVKACDAGAASGGGISVGGTDVSAAGLTLSNTTITQNVSASNGGGVHILHTVIASIDRTTIADNSASCGGGLFLSSAEATLTQTTISGNRAERGGGGICVEPIFASPSILKITDTTIASNVSTAGGGGGLRITGGIFADAKISRTTIAGNSALSGGGIDSAAIVTLANTTISGNTATTNFGGAVAHVAPSFEGGLFSALTLVGVTITSNVSATSGAVHLSATQPGRLRVRNTIIAHNTAVASSNCVLGSTATDLGNNLEYPGTACGFDLASDWRSDPRLAPLAFNGGPTQTHALGSGSPAVDAGDDATCAATPVSGVDQRGVARQAGSRCDIGAYESEFVALRRTTGDFEGDQKADLTLYRPSTGTWWIRVSSVDYLTHLEYFWGVSTDVAVPGDYDGDGKTDIAVYRPSTGVWYLLQSSTNFTTFITKAWGIATDIPVPGDYDGDGKPDLVVYRPSTGVWYILTSSTNYTGYIVQEWGTATDIPVFAGP